jgi:hypothetical protein
VRLDHLPHFHELVHLGTCQQRRCHRGDQVVAGQRPHERAAALPPLDQAAQLQGAQRLAHRRAAHLERLGQHALGRELVAGAQIALLDEALDLLDDVLVDAAAPHRLQGSHWALLAARLERPGH